MKTANQVTKRRARRSRLRPIQSQLDQLETAQLVRRIDEEEATYIFKHVLTQDAAYESLLKQTRYAIHRYVAKTIEQIYVERLDEFAAVLAQHYAQTGDDAKTVEYAIRAGDVAARLNAATEARLHFAHALDALAHLPVDDQNRRRRMEILIKQASVSVFADAPTRNIARLDEAEALAKQFVESDSEVQRQLVEIYFLKGFIYQMGNDPRAALRYYNEVHAIALPDDQLMAQTFFNMGLLLNVQGRFGEAEPLMRDGINRMRRVQMPLEGWAFSNLGWALAAQGLYAEGLAEAQRGVAMAQQTNQPGSLETTYTGLAQIYLIGGDIPQMLEAARTVLATAEQSHDLLFVCMGLLYVARAQSHLGQHQTALENMQKATDVTRMLQGHVPVRDLFAAIEAEIALNAGQIEDAQTLAEQAVSLSQAVDAIYAQGVAQRVWGQSLAAQNPPRWDEADAHLAASLQLFEEGNARLDVARTHVVWGKVLRARGDENSAREHFDQAAVQFEKSGITHELNETRALTIGK